MRKYALLLFVVLAFGTASQGSVIGLTYPGMNLISPSTSSLGAYSNLPVATALSLHSAASAGSTLGALSTLGLQAQPKAHLMATSSLTARPSLMAGQCLSSTVLARPNLCLVRKSLPITSFQQDGGSSSAVINSSGVSVYTDGDGSSGTITVNWSNSNSQ